MVSQLSERNQTHLEEILRRGGFSSEDQAIEAALDLLDDALKAARLDEKLRSSVRQSEQGQVVLDSPEWRKAHLEELIERFNSGERADPNYFD
ncbi:hypothetical protein BH09CHL1_BH09CHL1_31630 [soil metagenome]